MRPQGRTLGSPVLGEPDYNHIGMQGTWLQITSVDPAANEQQSLGWECTQCQIDILSRGGTTYKSLRSIGDKPLFVYPTGFLTT